MLNKLVLQGQYWGAWDSDGKAVCLDCEPGGRLWVWAALLPWRHSTCLRGDTALACGLQRHDCEHSGEPFVCPGNEEAQGASAPTSQMAVLMPC